MTIRYLPQTACDIQEEGEDNVKSSWPLWAGLHTCYNGDHKGKQWRKSERILEKSPQFGLLSATREHEDGITSNRGSARHGESVPGPCTPRPSRSGSRVDWKPWRCLHTAALTSLGLVLTLFTMCALRYLERQDNHCASKTMTKNCLATRAKS